MTNTIEQYAENETRQTDIFSTPPQESETGGISDTDRIQDGKGPRQGKIL